MELSLCLLWTEGRGQSALHGVFVYAGSITVYSVESVFVPVSACCLFLYAASSLLAGVLLFSLCRIQYHVTPSHCRVALGRFCAVSSANSVWAGAGTAESVLRRVCRLRRPLYTCGCIRERPVLLSGDALTARWWQGHVTAVVRRCHVI